MQSAGGSGNSREAKEEKEGKEGKKDGKEVKSVVVVAPCSMKENEEKKEMMMKSNFDMAWFVEGEEVGKRWGCAICFNVINKIAETRCGHTFCEGCLSEAVQKKASCPTCRAPCEGHQASVVGGQVCVYSTWYLSPSRDREVGEFAVQCLFKPCTWKGQHKALAAHRESCAHHFVVCDHCVFVFPRQELAKHVNQCAKRPQPCEECNQLITEDQVAEHRSRLCFRRKISCPLACGVQLPFASLWRHLEDQCPKRVLACEYSFVGCPFTGTQTAVEEHSVETPMVAHHGNLLLRHLIKEREKKEARRLGRYEVKELPRLKKVTGLHTGAFIQQRVDERFRTVLKTGDILDAWDGKGWFLAKVVNVSDNMVLGGAGTPGGQALDGPVFGTVGLAKAANQAAVLGGDGVVLVHFLGWDNRYDRWIARNSPHLAPLRTHSGPNERRLLEDGSVPNEAELYPYLEHAQPAPSYWSCCGSPISNSACAIPSPPPPPNRLPVPVSVPVIPVLPVVPALPGLMASWSQIAQAQPPPPVHMDNNNDGDEEHDEIVNNGGAAPVFIIDLDFVFR